MCSDERGEAAAEPEDRDDPLPATDLHMSLHSEPPHQQSTTTKYLS